jgi:cytochrome c oxidase subunit 2
MFWTLMFLTVFFTIGVLSFMLFLAIRYRASNKKVNRKGSHDHHIGLELTWSIIPLIMGLGMFLWTAWPYASIFSPPKNAMQIYVIGKRWMWHMQHPNGVRENNELHLPVGKPVNITMISQDVIHGLYIPAFRIKRDALPGRYNQMWFTPNRVGTYYLFCSEYCGTNHSEMRGTVTVMPVAEYEKWLANGGATVASEHQTLEEKGQALYTQYACGTCHDSNGVGRGPSLQDVYGSKVLLKDGTSKIADDSYLRESILNPSDDIAAGYQQVMPSYKDQLTEEQVLHLIAYIKSLRTPKPLTSPATGKGQPAVNPPTTGAAATTPPAKTPLAPNSNAATPVNPAGPANATNAPSTTPQLSGSPATAQNPPGGAATRH